jgi:hypothetical protein
MMRQKCTEKVVAMMGQKCTERQKRAIIEIKLLKLNNLICIIQNNVVSLQRILNERTQNGKSN